MHYFSGIQDKMSSMEYLIPTDDQPPKNIEEAHHMIKFHTKIFVLLTSFQLVAILAKQPFLALNIVFCLYMVSYQIWRCIVLINDHFALRALVDVNEDEDEGEGDEEDEGEEGEVDEGGDEEDAGEEGEVDEGGDEEDAGEEGEQDEGEEGECDEEKPVEDEDVDMNGNAADDEGTVPMEVVDEVTDMGADGVGTQEATQEVVAAASVPIPQSEDEEVKPRPRRRRRQD